MSISVKIKDSLSRSSWIRKMFEEGSRLSKIYGPENVYDFTLGNPDLEPPAEFKANLYELAANPIPGMHHYMNNAGYLETRQAVAEHINLSSGLNLSANHVLMTVGAGGGLNAVFKALLNPDEEVIVSAPYFVEYGSYVDNHQGKLVVVRSQPDFQLDLANIERAINSKTKVVLINSPNNPTGVIYTEASLQKLARLIAKKEAELGKTIYLVSDEPYAGLVYDGLTVPVDLEEYSPTACWLLPTVKTWPSPASASAI